jgi:hypothetical protein
MSEETYELEVFNDPGSSLYIMCDGLRSISEPCDLTPEEAYRARWISKAPESDSKRIWLEQEAIRRVMKYNGSSKKPIVSLKLRDEGGICTEFLDER